MALDAALDGDTRQMQSNMLHRRRSSTHTLALFGWLLQDGDKRWLTEILRLTASGAHYSAVPSSSPAKSLGDDSIKEIAAASLGATELAAALRERMARKYAALNRPELAGQCG